MPLRKKVARGKHCLFLLHCSFSFLFCLLFQNKSIERYFIFKRYCICCKIFKVCLTLLGHYALKVKNNSLYEVFFSNVVFRNRGKLHDVLLFAIVWCKENEKISFLLENCFMR